MLARRWQGVGAVAAIVVLTGTSAVAQSGDVVEVTSGDRLTGDVAGLERGVLSFRTAAAPGRQRFAGTIAILWSEVVRLTSIQTLDIELVTGERLTGTISSPAPGQLVVQTPTGPPPPIAVEQFVWMAPLESGFRGRTSGTIDVGLSYTNAQDAWVYTLNLDALHRSPTHAYETEVVFNSTLTTQSGAERQTRNDLLFDVHRRLPRRWYTTGLFEVQEDAALELDLRLVVGGGVGLTVVRSNAIELSVQGGVDYAAERYASVSQFDHSAELFAGASWDWFATGDPVEGALMARTYFSLARQRARAEIDGSVRRDLRWSLYWAANVLVSADSDPPGDRPRNDVSVSFALGWAF